MLVEWIWIGFDFEFHVEAILFSLFLAVLSSTVIFYRKSEYKELISLPTTKRCFIFDVEQFACVC